MGINYINFGIKVARSVNIKELIAIAAAGMRTLKR
jgi:hypothetical protein